MSPANQPSQGGIVPDRDGGTQRFHDLLLSRNTAGKREPIRRRLATTLGLSDWRARLADLASGLAIFAGGAAFGAGGLLAILEEPDDGRAVVILGSGPVFVLVALLLRRLTSPRHSLPRHAAET